MSSGQAAWADEMAEKASEEHTLRLSRLGYHEISVTASDIANEIRRLEALIGAMPRAGWTSLDRLKDLVRKLG